MSMSWFAARAMACAMLAAVGRSFSLAPKGRLARPLCAATMDVGVEAPPRLKIKSIVEAEAPESLVGTRTVIKGWARTVRAQKALGFLEVTASSWCLQINNPLYEICSKWIQKVSSSACHLFFWNEERSGSRKRRNNRAATNLVERTVLFDCLARKKADYLFAADGTT